MFARLKESRQLEYLQIVENFREGGKVRQRVVLYVGSYEDIDDALRRMPRQLRYWRRRATNLGEDEVHQKKVGHLRDRIEATDERLRALRALIEEHPDLVERDRKRAARHAKRQTQAMRERLGGYPGSGVNLSGRRRPTHPR